MGLLEALGLKSGPEKQPASVNDYNYQQEVLKSNVPVLLDVWSDGCGPCLALVPTIKRLAAKYDGRVKVAEINAGRNPKVMGKLGVRGTPTVVVYKKGVIVDKIVGMRGQHYYEELIENELLPQQPSVNH